MRFSRRTLLKASAAAGVMGSLGAPLVARAQQAEFTYKYANNLPDSHPLNIRAKEMSAAIKTETNGRFDLQIFPNNQLGSDTDMLSQIRSGGVEFFTLSGLILSTLVPAASINFSEVYSALQTKIVEGQENPLALISTAKLYEVQKYCSLTNHMWDGFWFLANRRAWEKLPADVRDIVAKNINAAAIKERADTEKLNATVMEELKGKGLIFNQPQVAPFRQKLRDAKFYAEWKGKYGDQAWELLEKSVGKLA